MKAGTVIVWGVVGLAAAYGITYLVRQGQLLSDTGIDYVGYKVQGLSLQRAQVKITLRITNKSNWDFTILDQKYKAKLNGIPVGDIKSIKPVTVYKGTYADVDLLLDFNPLETLKTGAQQLVANFGNAQLNISGSFLAQTSIIVYNYKDVDETWTMKNFKVS